MVDADMVQTAPYRPWELFHSASGRVPVRTRYDVWAFACVLYEVGAKHPRSRGHLLFGDVPMKESWEFVRASRDWRIDRNLRECFRDLARRCLDPHQRPLEMASVVMQLREMS